ncbi:hypothetical protein EV359DRAFT_59755 [Lentinula novae-zelandiae]|nr:hypothetical protein EV359DRAFT_59755 [Lentinula novae-zelandiae]
MARHATRRKLASSRNIPGLPNELIVMIFNTCLTSDRAVLLQVSKHFHELGLRSLYHSIWITKICALESLHRTLVDANSGYAKLIRVFEVIIVKSDQFPTFVSPDTDPIQDILFQLKNVEKVQVYAPTLITKDFGMAKGRFSISKILYPQCLTSFTFGVSWSDILSNAFEVLLSQLASLEHLSIECVGHFSAQYSINVKANLPNLTTYKGPSILLQSLAQGSKRLSSLILEVFVHPPFQGGPLTTNMMSKDPTLHHLKKIGSRDVSGGERDGVALSFLQIICDSPAVANVTFGFLPQVEHLSLLCTSVKWITAERLPTDPWYGDFNLGFLSKASSLRKFSLSFVHSKQSLPWDLAVIAEFLGNLNSGLIEVHICKIRTGPHIEDHVVQPKVKQDGCALLFDS